MRPNLWIYPLGGAVTDDPMLNATLGLREDALTHVGLGLPVLPLLPRSKRPATRHGFHDATTDPQQVSDYWQRHPDANIGIRPREHEVVVDVDRATAATANSRK